MEDRFEGRSVAPEQSVVWRLGAFSPLANPLRLGLPIVREVALPRPGREDEQNARRLERPQTARLLRGEHQKRPSLALHLLILAAHPDPSRNDLEDGVLVEPVVAELVAVVQVDDDAAELGLREENARLTCPAGLDGRKMPALHLAHATTSIP
jgi:hypothetical protein